MADLLLLLLLGGLKIGENDWKGMMLS